jgi:hypothetical protein
VPWWAAILLGFVGGIVGGSFVFVLAALGGDPQSSYDEQFNMALLLGAGAGAAFGAVIVWFLWLRHRLGR